MRCLQRALGDIPVTWIVSGRSDGGRQAKHGLCERAIAEILGREKEKSKLWNVCSPYGGIITGEAKRPLRFLLLASYDQIRERG